MGLFDKLKNKAQDAINSINDDFNNENDNKHQEKEEVEEIYNEEEDYEIEDEDNDDDDFDETQMPKGWDGMTDDEILTKLSKVTLKYSQKGDDEAYLKKKGFENEDHLMGFMDYFRAMVAEKRGISMMDLMGQETIAYQEQTIKEAEGMKAEGGLMEPVEGIDCESWAKVNAKIASGENSGEAIKIIGVDMPKWDRVNQEWQTRMANDTSFVIAQVYGNAFTASATGNLGGKDDINEENFPYEKYIEISVAQDKLTAQGRDPQEVLAMFGLTVTDWSNVSAFWSNKFNQNTEYYYKEDTRLRKIYDEKYKTGSVHGDIEF